MFEGLGPEPIAPVEAPDGAVTTDPDVTRALDSVVHVRAESDALRAGPGRQRLGRVARAGSPPTPTSSPEPTGVTVSVRGTGRERTARVVAFDPRRDVAVLDVPDLGAPAARTRAPRWTPGTQAALAGFPGDNGLWVGARPGARRAARPGAPTSTATRASCREIYSLRAQVRRGASGGPVIDPRGEVVGMVFATSLDDPDTGYALTLGEIAPVLRRGVARLVGRVDRRVPVRLTGSVRRRRCRLPGCRRRRAGGRRWPPGAAGTAASRRRHPSRRTVP